MENIEASAPFYLRKAFLYLFVGDGNFAGFKRGVGDGGVFELVAAEQGNIEYYVLSEVEGRFHSMRFDCAQRELLSLQR